MLEKIKDMFMSEDSEMRALAISLIESQYPLEFHAAVEMAAEDTRHGEGYVSFSRKEEGLFEIPHYIDDGYTDSYKWRIMMELEDIVNQ